MADNGFEAAPARYTQQSRETIDRIRDDAGTWLKEGRYIGLSDDDAVFYAICRAMAMRYDDRQGAKVDPDGDREKARWYHGMALHILGVAGDPREKRPGFTPYAREGRDPTVTCSRLALELLQVGQRQAAQSLVRFMADLVTSLDAMALATGPDPRMGPGPLEGVRCLTLNDYVRRVFLRPMEKVVQTMVEQR